MRHFRSSNFRHVTDNWELTVKIFTLKWRKDNERATSSFRYISEAINCFELPITRAFFDFPRRFELSGVCKSKFSLHLEITLLYFVEFVHVIN